MRKSVAWGRLPVVLAIAAIAAPAGAQVVPDVRTLPGATIIDGTGEDPIFGPVTIEGDRIIAVGQTVPASDPQAYCINSEADFYPYTGELCDSGYQLGRHNCRGTDGTMHLVARDECEAMGGLVELPAPPVRRIDPERVGPGN
jgi:hypothetical protein